MTSSSVIRCLDERGSMIKWRPLLSLLNYRARLASDSRLRNGGLIAQLLNKSTEMHGMWIAVKAANT
jgi:hypothetical protein